MISVTRYLFVFDSAPGARELHESLGQSLRELDNGIDFDFYDASDPDDAMRHVSLYCDLHPDLDTCFVSCGGDALTAGVASGLMGSGEGKTMTVYDPAGTGSLARNYEGRDFGSIPGLLSGQAVGIDMIRVNNSYAVNACTFGMDDLAGPGESHYMQSLSTVLRRSFRTVRLTADGVRLDSGAILFMSLSNGRFTAEGYSPAPQARNDDGKADLCIVRNMPPGRLRKLLPMLPEGTFALDSSFSADITMRSVRTLGLESAKDITIFLDGRPLTGKQFSFKIVPGAVRLRIPAV